MIRYFGIAIIILVGLLGSVAHTVRDKDMDDMKVSDLLVSLGEDFDSKKPNYALKGVSAEAGKQMFHQGYSRTKEHGKSKKLSKHFVCSSCHNTEREDPDLRISDPDARLTYAIEHNLPFLQGTTMYGAVNRSTYYNGDYLYKYGNLVEKARNSIRESIQLCATECAQGRSLKDWEIESILAYLWELEYSVGDLDLSEEERLMIKKHDSENKDSLRSLIKAKYLSGSPASFIPPPADRKAGTGLEGDPSRGKEVYDRSCLHCHYQGKYSYLYLDNSSLSRNYLARAASSYSRQSIYQVIRWGVGSHYGKEAYMPQYPKEKLSDQQLADLLAYLKD